jgi:hypothetical protein
MSRSQIALRAGIDRETVTKYLAQPGAPQPNAKNLYEYHITVEWIRSMAPKLNAGSDEMKAIKLAMAKMQREDFEIDLNVKRGLYVEKKAIEPTIAAFMAQLTDDLRNKFEQELPGKYEAKSTVERAKINADAIDFVLTRMKTGAAPITS